MKSIKRIESKSQKKKKKKQIGFTLEHKWQNRERFKVGRERERG
jgi:hypothetical protein